MTKQAAAKSKLSAKRMKSDSDAMKAAMQALPRVLDHFHPQAGAQSGDKA